MTTLRYQWRRCERGKDTAFIGKDGLLKFGGMALLTMGSDEGQWDWDLNGLTFPRQLIRGQMAGTPREVAAFVEDEYDRLLPHSDGVDLQVEKEIQYYNDKGLPLPNSFQWRKAVFVDKMPNAEADALFRPDFKPSTLDTTHSRRSRR